MLLGIHMEENMSRRSRSSTPSHTRPSTVYRQLGRDIVKTSPIARPRLPRLRTVDLRVFEDRRLNTPVQHNIRPAFSAPRSASRLVVKNVNNSPRPDPFRPAFRGTIPHQIGFVEPKRVVICVRRQRRREVLHALRVAGRGGVGRGRKRHTNEYSQISC